MFRLKRRGLIIRYVAVFLYQLTGGGGQSVDTYVLCICYSEVYITLRTEVGFLVLLCRCVIFTTSIFKVFKKSHLNLSLKSYPLVYVSVVKMLLPCPPPPTPLPNVSPIYIFHFKAVYMTVGSPGEIQVSTTYPGYPFLFPCISSSRAPCFFFY